MNQRRLAALTRDVAAIPSRRQLLRGLAGAGLDLGLGWGRRPNQTAANKKRKRKRRQPTPNAYGCLNVDAPCQSAAQCCSGICSGKKGKKRCRAHDVGVCRAGQTIGFCGGMNSPCNLVSTYTGVCGTTTGNAGFCVGGGDCYPCTVDAQCRPFCGAGAACVRCATCTKTGGTMCASAGVHICDFES
jgi:hypothetical protein